MKTGLLWLCRNSRPRETYFLFDEKPELVEVTYPNKDFCTGMRWRSDDGTNSGEYIRPSDLPQKLWMSPGDGPVRIRIRIETAEEAE